MAKTPDFDYLFKLLGDNQMQLSKTSDDQILVQYLIKGNLRGQAICDCPASWHQKRHGKPDKHVGWVNRYMKLTDQLRAAGKLTQGAFVYYKSAEDRFYLNTAFATPGPDETIQE